MILKKTAICLLFLSCVILPINPLYAEENAGEILEQADNVLHGNNCYEYTTIFEIYKDNKIDNTYTMINRLKGRDKMLAVFTEPLRIKDQAILRNADDQWIYFPNLKKGLKLSTRQQLAGSDFSYGDILNIDLESEYEAVILDENITQEGIPCYKLELTAKVPTATYARIVYYVGKHNYYAIKREFYTKSGKKFKVLVFSEHDEAGIPRKWKMSSLLDPGSVTIMHIKDVTISDIPDSCFSLEYLRRAR